MPLSAALTPLARDVLKFIHAHGYITAERAWDHMGKVPSASLTRRITELRDAGYDIRSSRRVNPVNGRRYTSYTVHMEGVDG